MGNLFLSFIIAIGGAIGLVIISRTFDMDLYTTRIFPLIPIFYALIYELFEKLRTGKDKPIHPAKAKEEMKAGVTAIFQNITAGRIFTAIGVSIILKLIFEILFMLAYFRFDKESLSSFYGPFGFETIAMFLKGERHPWLDGNEGLYLLSLLAVVTSFGTGLWIGFTSKGKAILEGVLVGAAATIISAMTNMLILYSKIEELANQSAEFMGYSIRIGFVTVLTLQVLFYGLWSGIAQRAKQERITRRSQKSMKRQKK